MSYFSTANANASYLPTVKFTPRFKIHFVIVVAPTNFFKTLTTQECLLFSTLFLLIAVFASGIAILGAVEEVTMGEVGVKFSLTGSYLPNQTFLGVVYSFFFSIH